jgi:protein N-terminal amidase
LISLTPNSVDLIVLPEMALSGYMFTTPSSILPYLEPQRIGPTSLLCRKLAKKLGCCVIAGYPEILPSPEESSEVSSSTPHAAAEQMSGLSVDAQGGGKSLDIKGEALGVGYNSALVVNKTGEVVGNYRKTFRFETDKNWAREGECQKMLESWWMELMAR